MLIIAGCGDDSDDTTTSPTTSSTSATSATSASSAATASSSTAASGTTTLAVATNAKLGKPILVDSSGKTVYLYEPDGTNTTSQASAGLKATWPPVTASGEATVSSDLDASKVGTSTQPDGTTQVSYNGHLLYLFAGDAAEGDANGQGLGGVWFVLSPEGEKLP